MNTFAFNLQRQRNSQLAKMVCIGLLVQGLMGCSDADKQFPVAGEIFPLSALDQITTIGGDEIDFKGKTLLINFWATWCAPCRSEMPDLQKLSDSLDAERFAVIGVSVDDDSNLIREFLLQYKINFRIFQDENFRLASDQLGIKTYPETFIVSPRGIITRRISEAISRDQNIMKQLLEAGGRASAKKLLNSLNG
jgi:thiol-disulfide isomerase/thioredoxin